MTKASTYAWLLLFLTGCVAPPFNWGKKTEPPPGPADSMVLRGSGLEAEKLGPDAPVYAELEGAKKLFQENDFDKAEPIFAKLANNTKNPLPVAEEARYCEGECQRLKGNYRSAEATYKRLMKDFRTGQYTDQANRRLFDIANYWLDETRDQMKAYEEKREGKRWVVWPGSFVHFTKDKPLFDLEGHAVQCLEEVRLNDINGPLGEKALFFLATVKYFREDYREADFFYTDLYTKYPNSPFAEKAIKQAILCKTLATGGTAYDARPVEEARKLIDTAMHAYPKLASQETEFMKRQIISINLQQAKRDWDIAEFYRRTGKPGSAYFYYELVRRRYPGTTYADDAVKRLADVRGRAEIERAAQERNDAATASEDARGPRRGLMSSLFTSRQKTAEEQAPAPTPPPIPGTPLR